METVFTFLVQWAGVILGVILGLIVIFSTSADGLTKMEKELANDDDESHYLVNNSMGSFWAGFLILVAGCGVSYVIGYLGIGTNTDRKEIIALAVELIIAVLTTIIFLFLARKSLVERVLVNGNEIIIHQRFGKPQNTSFDKIRTVKKSGGDTAMASDSITLRPNGSRRFTVKKSMKNFNKFATQVERDVPLPDLTKKRDDWDED